MVVFRPGELPTHPDARHYLQAIVGLGQTQSWPLVDSLYRDGLQQWPPHRDLGMGYGTVLYLQRRPRAAARECRTVLSQYPGFAPAHNNLAVVLAGTGQYHSAVMHVHCAIDRGGVHSGEYQTTLKQIIQMQGAAEIHGGKPGRGNVRPD